MLILALADEPPSVELAQLAADNHPDALVTLGDLQAQWLRSAAELELPRWAFTAITTA